MDMENRTDPWEDEEDHADDLMMEKMVGAAKTFQIIVFVLVFLLVVAMVGGILLYRNA